MPAIQVIREAQLIQGMLALPEHQASLAGIAEHRTIQGTLALPEHQASLVGIAEHRTMLGTLAMQEHQASQAAMQEIRIKIRETRQCRRNRSKCRTMAAIQGIPKTAAVQTTAAVQETGNNGKCRKWRMP